jgi:hypothetical protein
MLKKAVSKAAASEESKAYPLGYVESLNDVRTLLADFFSILIGLSLPIEGCSCCRPSP